MGLQALVKKIFTNLGENNNAVYAVMSIAVAKGTFRPIFTMMDKKQDPDSKKYAAFREGLTEAIAVPTYFASGMLAGKIAPKFLNKNLVKVVSKDNVELTLTDQYRQKFDDILHIKKDLKKQSKPADEIKKAFNAAVETLGSDEKNLFHDYKSKLKIVKETTSFVGVCMAALVIIPGLCNIVLPPVMKCFKSLQAKNNKKNNVLPNNDSKPLLQKNINYGAKLNDTNILHSYMAPKANSGMKVGV